MVVLRERKFTLAKAEKYCARWTSIHYDVTLRAEFYSVHENASLEYAVESGKRCPLFGQCRARKIVMDCSVIWFCSVCSASIFHFQRDCITRIQST